MQLAVGSLVLLGILIVVGIDWRWASVTMAFVFLIALLLPRAIPVTPPFFSRERDAPSDNASPSGSEPDDSVTQSDKRIVSAISCALAAITLLWASEHLAYKAVCAYRLAQAERTWPTTDAIIVHSHIETTSENATRWTPVWDYSYTVNHDRYIARSTDLIGGFAQTWYEAREQAEDAADDRPIGTHTIVFYDPENPGQSVLDRSDPAWHWGGVTVAAFCFLSGTLLAVMGLLEFRRHKSLTA